MPDHITVPMHEGAVFDFTIPDWLRLNIADCVILFGRIEQKTIEIAWLLNNEELKRKLKTARNPATDNFEAIVELVEQKAGQKFEALRISFDALANARNLIVHGAWLMVDGNRPWVVWHKFLEDDNSVIGEFFEKPRFDAFIRKADFLHQMLCKWHNMLESESGKKTSALTSLQEKS
jgi:hypothetical protein